MRVAIAQINTTLGNIKKNSDKIKLYITMAQERHCNLVVFPENTLFGYHPFDLLERKEFFKKQIIELKKIQKELPNDMAAIIGVITLNTEKKENPTLTLLFF